MNAENLMKEVDRMLCDELGLELFVERNDGELEAAVAEQLLGPGTHPCCP